MRTLYLIRHGKPDFPGGVTMCLGKTDVPLGALGRLQACLAGAALEDAGLTAVYCSGLSRSRESAEYLGVPAVELAGLEELYAGDWDGLAFPEIRERWPELFAARRTNQALQMPGAEEREHGQRRFISAVNKALDSSRGDIAIVAHASVMQLFLCTVLGMPLEASRELPLPYGSITPLQYEGGTFLCGDVSVPHPELDAAICRRLLDAVDTPENITEHCAAVAKRAMSIVCALAVEGVYLDEGRIFAAAALHDIARRGEDHARAGGELISALGYPEVGELIRQHHDPDEPSHVDEAAVVFIADKTVRGTDRVSLSGRFEKSREKCETPEALEAWEKRYAAARTVADNINAACGKKIIP